MTEDEIIKLKKLAAHIRYDTIKAIKQVGQGHIGGSLSIADLLAVLYGKQMQYDSTNPNWEDRDRLVLSKGHAGPALYSTLAISGFFPEETLLTLNQGGTILPSHPDRLKTPGIDVTTGSLGQGTSQAAGIATGLRMDNKKSYVYLIVGDGELNEGQCWEAFQYIASTKLDNLIVVIDENKKQLDGATQDIMNPFDIESKIRAFGFTTLKVKGDDVAEIDSAINYLKNVKNSAKCIVLDSIKGAGVPFFANMDSNHSVKFNNNDINDETEVILQRLKKVYAGE